MNVVSELTATSGAAVGDGGVLAGRYHLRGLLGRGGMADVHLAQDEVLGRPVAVKVFHSGPGALADPRRRRQEAELLAGLNHPGLVTVFDAGVDPNRQQAFLVMEIVSGPTLAAQLTTGPLPESEVREVGACLAEALAHVHEHGIVHRDVKPGNVLFTDCAHDRRIKLADFGIARLANSAGHTEVGLIVGSARYLSPEQAVGAEVGPPTDVYALGLVLLECLTGTPAYPGAGIAVAAERLHRDPKVPDHIDPRLGLLLTAMTNRLPAARPTAREAAAVLQQAPDTQPLHAVHAPGDLDRTTEQRLGAIPAKRIGPVHRRAWVVAACAAVVVTLAGSAALLGQSTASNEPASVAPAPTATPDLAEAPPGTPTTANPPAQPAIQPAAPAQPVANPDADQGGEEADNQGNGGGSGSGNGNVNDKDKAKEKNKGKGKS